MTPAELLADSLACHRLTRLVTADTITQPLRDRALAWLWRDRYTEVRDALSGPDSTFAYASLRALADDPRYGPGAIQDAMETGALSDPPKLATLITCRHCAGVYVAAFVTLMRWREPRAWHWAARLLACASAAALWASVEDD